MESDNSKPVSDPLIVPIFWEDERPARDWFMVNWILVERYLKGML